VQDHARTDIPAFKLAPQQERLFKHDALTPVSVYASLVEAARDDAEIRAAVEGFASAHEILRTTFVHQAGLAVPRQAVHERLSPEWEVRELSDASAVAGAIREEAARPFDVEHGPTFRALLLKVPDAPRVLVLSTPAACLDRASLLLLHRGLAQPLADDPLQYADYAEWRAEFLSGDDADAEQGRRSWSDAAAAPAASPVILFGSAVEAPEAVERVPVSFDANEIEALQRAASDSRASEAIFLEAAWHTLLHRVSGEPEIEVAGEETGRAQQELEEAIGAYAQPVAIRTRFEEDTSFAEILDQVRRARAAVTRWQDYASAQDLAAATERNQVGFGYLAGVPSEVIEIATTPLPVAVGLSFRAGDAGLRGELVFDPSAYTRRDAEEVATRFKLLLASATADPALAVSRLAIAAPDERAELLERAGAAPIERSSAPIHHLFEERAGAAPDLPAVTGETETLSYRELNAAANRLAHHLRELGVGRDVPVGLCMDRSPATIAALLGILKAGGAYLPLNFEHPAARLAHQLEEAGATVLVTQEPLLDRLPAFAGTTVCVDRDADAIAARPAENPVRVNEIDDLVYVMYTSGSTGLPKGVAVSHANLANYTADIVERLEVEEGPHFAVVSALSTDLGNTALFPALVAGGCIHLLGPQAAMDADVLAAYAAEHPFDVMKITPSHLTALLAGDGAAAVLPRRWLVLGGEALSWELVERIRALDVGCRILNHYGPTETTVGSCVLEVPGSGTGPSVPIGRPIANTRAYVLDRELEPVPAGVPGELCIGGAGVARGYVNRPDETAERFVIAPFGDRVYRTGDRARLLRDGTIEFQGRLDQQVKIRGFRVEPGEIEAALLRHPAVRQAAVTVRDTALGDAQLVAYVVATPAPAVDELQAFLGESLPDYMVPSAFASLDALPFTPSGKIDRLALPDPASLQAKRDADYVAPRDALEEEIAAIWADLLAVERVGVFDDFFALGGHSLLATQMIIRIRRTHGDIQLHALLRAPTVAALADVIRGSEGDQAGPGFSSPASPSTIVRER
jgi:amino acid adenylation domain-containing protein